jgi:hypothetical protein
MGLTFCNKLPEDQFIYYISRGSKLILFASLEAGRKEENQ